MRDFPNHINYFPKEIFLMENITRNSYLVDISKGNGIDEFTNEHLELHKSIHNPINYPEYYTDLMPYGLDYVDTVLMDDYEIDCIIDAFLVQLYRKGQNPKYNQIKSSMSKGFDLREKPLQVIISDDGEPLILFNGNTTHNILCKYSSVRNRPVALYKKNSFYSEGNLLLIGGNQNALENPSGSVTWEDVKQIIDGYLLTKELVLKENPTKEDIDLFVTRIKKKITFSSNNTISVDTAIVNAFVNGKVEDATGVHSIKSVRTPSDVLEYLQEEQGFRDTQFHKYHAAAALAMKLFPSWKTKNKELRNAYESNTSNVKPENITVDTVIHMGSPDPSNPVGDFWKKYYDFYSEFCELENFQLNSYANSATKTNRYNIIGFFQQVKELEGVFPFGSIVTPDDFLEEYNKRHNKEAS